LTRFVGLTGGLGAGKSEALAAFERRDVPVLSTDKVAHDILDDDQVREALLDRWGEESLRTGRWTVTGWGDRLRRPRRA
jgi:dephospho-CoA kinase